MLPRLCFWCVSIGCPGAFSAPIIRVITETKWLLFTELLSFTWVNFIFQIVSLQIKGFVTILPGYSLPAFSGWHFCLRCFFSTTFHLHFFSPRLWLPPIISVHVMLSPNICLSLSIWPNIWGRCWNFKFMMQYIWKMF